jgi:hypothetical protein
LRPKTLSVCAATILFRVLEDAAHGIQYREILDHLIALNESHLRRVIRDYVNYHHEVRIHDSLSKDTPTRRPVGRKPSANATAISSARLGGQHHRYTWEEAA